MAVSRSVFNLSRWRGARPGSLHAGRVPVHVGSVKANTFGLRRVQQGYSNILINSSSTSVDSKTRSATITLPTAVVVGKCRLTIERMNITGYGLPTAPSGNNWVAYSWAWVLLDSTTEIRVYGYQQYYNFTGGSVRVVVKWTVEEDY